MKFKALITEDSIDIEGTSAEVLTGLVMYIKTLIDSDISEKTIREVIELAFKNKKEKKYQNVRVQKFDLNGLSKEEAKKLLDEEIFNKLFS